MAAFVRQDIGARRNVGKRIHRSRGSDSGRGSNDSGSDCGSRGSGKIGSRKIGSLSAVVAVAAAPLNFGQCVCCWRSVRKASPSGLVRTYTERFVYPVKIYPVCAIDLVCLAWLVRCSKHRLLTLIAIMANCSFGLGKCCSIIFFVVCLLVTNMITDLARVCLHLRR